MFQPIFFFKYVFHLFLLSNGIHFLDVSNIYSVSKMSEETSQRVLSGIVNNNNIFGIFFLPLNPGFYRFIPRTFFQI